MVLALLDVLATALDSASAECSPFAPALAQTLRFGPLSTVLLPLGAPRSRTVVSGHLEVDEVHPVGIRAGRADAEDLGVVEIPRAVLGNEGAHHPVGAAKHEAAAVSRRVRVDLPGHAPQDVLVVGVDVDKVVEDGGDVAQGRGHVEVAVQHVHLVRPHGLVYMSQKLGCHCRLLGGDVVEGHGAERDVAVAVVGVVGSWPRSSKRALRQCQDASP